MGRNNVVFLDSCDRMQDRIASSVDAEDLHDLQHVVVLKLGTAFRDQLQHVAEHASGVLVLHVQAVAPAGLDGVEHGHVEDADGAVVELDGAQVVGLPRAHLRAAEQGARAIDSQGVPTHHELEQVGVGLEPLRQHQRALVVDAVLAQVE
eukprot:1105761-Rhodomonas_salina.1